MTKVTHIVNAQIEIKPKRIVVIIVVLNKYHDVLICSPVNGYLDWRNNDILIVVTSV